MRVISFSAAAEIQGANKIVVDAATQTPMETLAFMEQVGKIERGTIIVPIPRANSALLQIAGYWSACDFTLGLTTLGQNASLVDAVDVQAWRNDVGRKKRGELVGSDDSDLPLVINAGRPMSPGQRADLTKTIGEFREELILQGYQANFADGIGILETVSDALTKILSVKHIGRSVYLLPPGAGQLAVLVGVALYALTENWPLGVFMEPDENREFQFSRIEKYGDMVGLGQNLALKWNKLVYLEESLARAIFDMLPQSAEKTALEALLS